jgi:hypothetical protein
LQEAEQSRSAAGRNQLRIEPLEELMELGSLWSRSAFGKT